MSIQHQQVRNQPEFSTALGKFLVCLLCFNHVSSILNSTQAIVVPDGEVTYHPQHITHKLTHDLLRGKHLHQLSFDRKPRLLERPGSCLFRGVENEGESSRGDVARVQHVNLAEFSQHFSEVHLPFSFICPSIYGFRPPWCREVGR